MKHGDPDRNSERVCDKERVRGCELDSDCGGLNVSSAEPHSRDKVRESVFKKSEWIGYSAPVVASKRGLSKDLFLSMLHMLSNEATMSVANDTEL